MIDEFVEMLRTIPAPPGCANPYAVHVDDIDARPDAAEIRARQLGSYLRRRRDTARLLLIAEAPGYQGARFSGLAMTCERTLLGAKPDVPADLVLGPDVAPLRTSAAAAGRNGPERRDGFNEPTASIVWRDLVAAGATDAVVLWNVFPFHPHAAGQPLTNRTPTPAEVLGATHVVESFLKLFPGRPRVAVGQTARRHLEVLGQPCAAAVRHPANGGATAFRAGLAQALSATGLGRD